MSGGTDSTRACLLFCTRMRICFAFMFVDHNIAFEIGNKSQVQFYTSLLLLSPSFMQRQKEASRQKQD